MNTAIKNILMVILFMSCTICTIAQSNYYYYKGNKIPLTINSSRVCISVPKHQEDICKLIKENIGDYDRIKDDIFDLYVISQSELERLSTLGFWKQHKESIAITPSFNTEAEAECVLTPYLNVRLKRQEDIDVLTSYTKKLGINIVKNDRLMPLWYIISVPASCDKNALEYANALSESGEFAASIPDLCPMTSECNTIPSEPNDPMIGQQWGLHNSDYEDIDISALPAWEYSTGKGVKIGILDTGVESTHIDLAANISNLSYDADTGTSPSIVYREHGTLCAGIAAAVKDNGIQIAGVAPDAEIVPISSELEALTNNYLKRANGIVWAYQNGVDIISNSWEAVSFHSALDEAIQDAFLYGRNGKGCVVVFSAGNNNRGIINYPANCNDTILVVGAIDREGIKTMASNYGIQLDLVAPGDSILTTALDNTLCYSGRTSMACAHVAGVAALILERNSELTVEQVNNIIIGNAKKIPAGNFTIARPEGTWCNKYGYGLVDAYSSVINTPSNVYIQNETITGTRTIAADRIYVGQDVTTTKGQGDVILGQGEITLKGNYIEIKNSTDVPIGTTLTIENY